MLVGPDDQTVGPIILDTTSIGLGGPLDMEGPEVGIVRYRLTAGGDLALSVLLRFSWRNTAYEVYLVSGDRHCESAGFRAIGHITTDEHGWGTAQLMVPRSILAEPPFGPSAWRSDHLDILWHMGDASRGSYVASLHYGVSGETPAQACEQFWDGDPHDSSYAAIA